MIGKNISDAYRAFYSAYTSTPTYKDGKWIWGIANSFSLNLNKEINRDIWWAQFLVEDYENDSFK